MRRRRPWLLAAIAAVVVGAALVAERLAGWRRRADDAGRTAPDARRGP